MNHQKVLVVYSGWLGDLVWIIPLIHALKRIYASVSLVVSEVQAPLAAVMKNGLVDEVYVDVPSQRLTAAGAVRKAVRARGIKTCIDLKGRGKTGIFMPWGPQCRIWIPHRRDAREYWLARGIHPGASCMPLRAGEHMVDAYLSGIRHLCPVDEIPVSFSLPFSGETVDAGERIIEREGLRTSRSVVLHPGSAQFSKIWPAEKFRRLAEVLKQDLKCRTVLMGARHFAPNDDYDLKISREVFGDHLISNLVEETSLEVDAYLLSSGAFAVSIGNDSFANHMAGSAGEVAAHESGAIQAANGRWYKANRTVSLFAPTNPVYCRPYDPTGSFNTVVMPETYPERCVYDRKAHVCPHYGDRFCSEKAHCMARISVEQVVAAVERALEK